ncbi:preprotein translocase subunit SecY [Pediococcus pentosaceus]|jgi:preprotein translocase subunit SecY|uniref:Protein translocase subunit secY/sec61 alpha n=3 Tax=Pediococcus pentosaceus TaxID=1255 RepID=Q03HZ8_PEDPA|nr:MULTISPECIES: preprotein translocase subunit SecY [Pediococcus]ABJ67174.1 protein translocase subunit secY/sec61 alpha [Pediococcus pentosaceus ATCC 25745]ASC09260.1 Accessory Sec system protein translocase subunit SecY2 [Pediococcus pentosaceus]KAF5439926.1 preprotein translocase subunit SecY [Pediococcus sp. EKM202D]KAF5440633.1 preprotein translocase subunit SecY [Pediococcus sp. EKM201D]MBF7104337.1 preprotein translocase subunit SecY [Pediococcus pentosaceus]
MKNKFIHSELFSKVLFTLMMVVLMELGRQIVIPSLDSSMSRQVLEASPLLRNLSALTGGQANYPSLFSVGLGPYMTGMILFQAIQLLDIDELNKINDYKRGMIQRWISFVIALLQTLQFIYTIREHINFSGIKVWGIDYNLIVAFFVLVAGAMIVAWMSDMITKYGIGGSGVLILPGMIDSIPRVLLYGQGLGSGAVFFTPKLWLVLIISVAVVVIFTIFINKAELRIPLQRPFVQNDFSESYLPIRVLAAGSMPFMFTTTVFMIPSYIGSFVPEGEFNRFVQNYVAFDNPVGILIYCSIIVFLGYVFSFMNFQTERLTKNLKKSGDYIFNVVPGTATRHYLNQRLFHLSTVANIFFLIIVGTPLIVGLYLPEITNFAFVFANILILITIIDTTMDQFKTMYLRMHYDLL